MAAIRACSLGDLTPNQALRVVLDGVAIALVQGSDGVVHAIGDTCTHGDVSLSEGFVEGDTLECWAHGSAFSLCTGKPLNLPAFVPVPVYEVELRGEEIFIDPTVTKEIPS